MVYELLTDTLGHTSEVPCDPDMNFRYDDCLTSALARELNREFGCVVPFVTQMDGMQICRFNTTTEGMASKAKVKKRFSYLANTGISYLVCIQMIGISKV